MRICAFCGKGSIVAGGYSNRVRATKFNPTGKRRKQPNLQWVRPTGSPRQLICTQCLKGHKQLTSAAAPVR
jgi:ribosomal protein L28